MQRRLARLRVVEGALVDGHAVGALTRLSPIGRDLQQREPPLVLPRCQFDDVLDARARTRVLQRDVGGVLDRSAQGVETVRPLLLEDLGVDGGDRAAVRGPELGGDRMVAVGGPQHDRPRRHREPDQAKRTDDDVAGQRGEVRGDRGQIVRMPVPVGMSARMIVSGMAVSGLTVSGSAGTRGGHAATLEDSEPACAELDRRCRPPAVRVLTPTTPDELSPALRSARYSRRFRNNAGHRSRCRGRQGDRCPVVDSGRT